MIKINKYVYFVEISFLAIISFHKVTYKQNLFTIMIWTRDLVKKETYLCFRIDSVMLIEEGFNVTSVDASDKMLKYALKTRWDRRKEAAFDKWGEDLKVEKL